MENCVTKHLATAVDNPNLPYFDALQFRLDWSKFSGNYQIIEAYENGAWKINFGGRGVKIKILSNGNVYNRNVLIGPEFTLANVDSVYSIRPVDTAQKTEFLLIGLSKIERLWISYPQGIECKNWQDMQYLAEDVFVYQPGGQTVCAFAGYYESRQHAECNYISNLSVPSAVTTIRYSGDYNNYTNGYLHCDIEEYAKLTGIVNKLVVPYTDGDVATFSEKTNFTDVQCRNAECYGNIAAFGKCINLKFINIVNSNITGSVEELVSRLVTNGKTSGNITTFYTNGKVTFNGSEVLMNPTGYTIAWTSASDITVTAK